MSTAKGALQSLDEDLSGVVQHSKSNKTKKPNAPAVVRALRKIGPESKRSRVSAAEKALFQVQKL
jgi:hypothetical protein